MILVLPTYERAGKSKSLLQRTLAWERLVDYEEEFTEELRNKGIQVIEV